VSDLGVTVDTRLKFFTHVSFLIKDIDKLEKVQRRFTKRLPGLKHYTYFQRLNRLDLESLELRRLGQDLILTYK